MNLLTSDVIIKVLEYTQKIIEPAFNPNKVITNNLLNKKKLFLIKRSE